ncbi:UNVERIFIED_CONTAM: type II secretion system protein [Halobacillus marinus]|uniref:type II secretion system protein n=1 Tax=Bacillus sp. SB49 TaxID=1071080 RepID=UPI000420B339|nr:type II secretion system protein [Bacillus sp. SB49]QHT47152.1 type II secretion system protein [Bacillus sp. SB49]
MKNEGFTLLETIAAFSTVMVICLTVLPALTQLRSDQKELAMEREMAVRLYDELQLHTDEKPLSFHYTGTQPTAYEIQLWKSDSILTGCITWQRKDKETKEFCLHAPSS